MFQATNGQVAVFPLLVGGVLILFALLNRPLLRLLKMKPMSEVFTNPRFQRSARISEELARLVLAVLGVSYLVQGLGPLFLSSAVVQSTAWVLLGLAGVVLLVGIGVNLLHWKAR